MTFTTATLSLFAEKKTSTGHGLLAIKAIQHLPAAQCAAKHLRDVIFKFFINSIAIDGDVFLFLFWSINVVTSLRKKTTGEKHLRKVWPRYCDLFTTERSSLQKKRKRRATEMTKTKTSRNWREKQVRSAYLDRRWRRRRPCMA